MFTRCRRFHRPGTVGFLVLLFLSLVMAGCAPGRAAPAEAQPAQGACSRSIPEVFAQVSPAVVSITAMSINPYQLTDRVTRVMGSGVIIDPKGLILTNAHVVFGRQAIAVTLDDGTRLSADLVGADPVLDLALVRIPPPTRGTLPTATPGNSDQVRVGDSVLAIGNPLGLDQTLTRGIVSGINRILPETPFSLLEPLLQTDTPINPGNSGGPLLNRCGDIIGITTAILPEAQNIGFAIPINLAKEVIPSLLSKGRVIRPWLGFHGQLIGRRLREILRIPLVDGLLVEVVEPGSPAEKAGLQGGENEIIIGGRDFLVGGDIITSLNGAAMTSPQKLLKAVRKLRVGDTLDLTVFRDGVYRQVKYVLPERPVLPGDIGGDRLLAPMRGGNVLLPYPAMFPAARSEGSGSLSGW